MPRNINVIAWGGIGDLVVCTPTLRAIKQTYPDARLVVYCCREEHRDVLLYNPHVDAIRLVNKKFLEGSASRYLWKYPGDLLSALTDNNRKYYQLYFQHVPPTWLYTKSVKEIVPEIFEDLNITLDNTKVEVFFSPEEEEKARNMLVQYNYNTIVLHIHSRASRNHHWPHENWEKLVCSMPEYTFVQVGHPDEPYVPGALDWRGKTSVREVYCLLKYSLSFLGVDSNFSHVTNAFDLPGVVLFGDSSPVYWGHDNNLNIYKAVNCSPCYYVLWNNPCPYDHRCMNSITVEEVRTAVALQATAGRQRLALLLP